MGHIHWELHEIPIPPKAHINHTDGRVFLMSANGAGKMSRQVIGHATSETTMHPNDMYKYLYPEEWAMYYQDQYLPQHELHTGMYAASLGTGYLTGLYPILMETYGPLYANALMDFAMYSILDRTDTAQLFPERMASQVLFSKELYNDTWYSDLFKNKMTAALNGSFRLKWLKHCAEQGIKKVWLSIDGSNNDCNISDSNLCEHGKAKSGNYTNVVSFIWAVNAEDGTPVTYSINNGGMPDSKAFEEIISLLKNSGMEIEGVILDRGFCNHDVIDSLWITTENGEKKRIPYVLMMKGNTYGHTQMMLEHAEEIRWKVRNCVDEKGCFGISDKKKMFAGFDDEAYISLFFDGSGSTGRAITLISKVKRAETDAKKAIQEGKVPSIPAELSSYLRVVTTEKGSQIEINYDAWQAAIDQKGFSSIASQENYGAEKVNYIYNLRDSSEKQYMIMKSQLGYDVFRVHSDESLESRFVSCFIASVIRSEIVKGCKSLGYDTNRMIHELDRITLVLLTNGLYTAVHNRSDRQKKLLHLLGIEDDDFDVIAADVNSRINNAVVGQIRLLPDDPGRKKRPGRPRKEEKPEFGETAEAKGETTVRKGPGRPKGSKNKKTLEKEALQAGKQESVKRGPGRPKGSKNKPKVNKPKRGRGRPKGSKNKPKTTT